MRTRRSFLGGLLLLPCLVSLSTAQQVRPARGAPPLTGREIQLVTPAPGLPDGAEVEFGARVALTDDQLLVAAPTYSEEAAGAIQVFDRAPGGFVFRKQIEGAEPDDARFASEMVLDRDLLYVKGTDSGAPALFVFQRDLVGAGEWGQLAVIPLSVDAYTFDVDGDTLLVGDVSCCSISNAITVRERNAGGMNAWGVTAVLSAPTAPFGPMVSFGVQLALHGDVVVAVGSNDWVHSYSWFYFVYERDQGGPGAWGLVVAFPLLGFGFVTDIELEDDLLVTGSLWDADTFVRDREQGGPSAWGLAQTLPGCQDPECSIWFEPWLGGQRLRDGLVALAGAEYIDCQGPCNFRRDVVKIYEVVRRAGVPELVLRHSLARSASGQALDFGQSVDFLDDRLVVGSDLGVHVFELRTTPVRQAKELSRR